jgi:hypothetical protein
MKRLPSVCAFLFATLVSASALADKVAVLPFLGSATKEQLDGARLATSGAAISKAHTLASDSELVTAQTAIADGVADTKTEYQAAGRASSSQWVIVGHVTPHPNGPIPNGYRLEVEACQVDSGRVESLAREIDPTKANVQIGEMLALLLRPEGIANADIPWENEVVKPPPPPPPPPKKPPPPPPPPPPPKPVVPEPDRGYGIHAPFAFGIGFGVNGAFAHPSGGNGLSTFAFLGTITGEWAPLADEKNPQLLRGIAIRADFGGNFYGPNAIVLDAGARWAIPLVPKLRIFIGPEVTIGGFFVTTGDQQSRFLLRTDAFASIGFGEHVQIEAAFDVQSAFGATEPIVLGGAMVRALYRF